MSRADRYDVAWDFQQPTGPDRDRRALEAAALYPPRRPRARGERGTDTRAFYPRESASPSRSRMRERSPSRAAVLQAAEYYPFQVDDGYANYNNYHDARRTGPGPGAEAVIYSLRAQVDELQRAWEEQRYSERDLEEGLRRMQEGILDLRDDKEELLDVVDDLRARLAGALRDRAVAAEQARAAHERPAADLEPLVQWLRAALLEAEALQEEQHSHQEAWTRDAWTGRAEPWRPAVGSLQPGWSGRIGPGPQPLPPPTPVPLAGWAGVPGHYWYYSDYPGLPGPYHASRRSPQVSAYDNYSIAADYSPSPPQAPTAYYY